MLSLIPFGLANPIGSWGPFHSCEVRNTEVRGGQTRKKGAYPTEARGSWHGS